MESKPLLWLAAPSGPGTPSTDSTPVDGEVQRAVTGKWQTPIPGALYHLADGGILTCSERVSGEVVWELLREDDSITQVAGRVDIWADGQDGRRMEAVTSNGERLAIIAIAR